MGRHCERSRFEGRIGGSRARCACSNADGDMRGMVDGGIELWLLTLGEAVAAMDIFAIIARHFCHIIDVEIFVILSTCAVAGRLST